MQRAHSFQSGFVLPSVLAYIAAFTLVILIAAGSLERSRAIAISLDQSARLATALDSAEARAIFTFLTSRPVPGGIDTSGRSTSAEDLLLGVDTGNAGDPLEPANVWSASEGIRLMSASPVRTWAIYQDVSGLLSLNTTDADLLAGLLEQFDVRKDDAATMAARLADYQDDDNLRRPLGAERADYRLRKMDPPSNAPLRTPAELGQVLGWEGFRPSGELAFLSIVTSAPTQNAPRATFAPGAVRELVASRLASIMKNEDLLTEAMQSSLLPTDRARFILVAQDDVDGLYRVRLVEIQRQPTASARPYTRLLISENSMSQLPENWQPGANAQNIDSSQPEDR